jgi:hypothetical protein
MRETLETGGWHTLAPPQSRLPHPSRFSKGEHHGLQHPRTSIPCSFVQTAALHAIREQAQLTPSLLRPRIFALYHHQLLSAARVARQPEESRPLSQSAEQVRRRYRFVVVGYVVMPEPDCPALTGSSGSGIGQLPIAIFRHK